MTPLNNPHSNKNSDGADPHRGDLSYTVRVLSFMTGIIKSICV